METQQIILDRKSGSQPLLLADTQGRDLASGQDHESKRTSFIKSAQWTPDGTSIITNSSNNNLCTYVMYEPPDLLENQSRPLKLEPYRHIRSAEPVDALAIYPFFDLQDPQTDVILCATNEHPLRLHSAITGELRASYPLINSTTEAYIKPTSLQFSPDGSSFLAGSENLISIFDLSRPGDGPATSFQTGPKKVGSSTNPATSMRGLVTALDIDSHSKLLAAGTYTREVGLYDSGGHGDCLGVFSVKGTQADELIGGYGVTQLLWSPCGRYLYIVERKSDGVMFYDIRKSGQLLGWLTGRGARTNQRMKVDLNANANGHSCEIWAGDIDGFVKTWRDPQLREGPVEPHQKLYMHDAAVNSVGMHKSGGVVFSSSGQRHFDDAPSESRLRLWEL